MIRYFVNIACCLTILVFFAFSCDRTDKVKEVAKGKVTDIKKYSKKKNDKDWGDVYAKMKELEDKKKEAKVALNEKSSMGE